MRRASWLLVSSALLGIFGGMATKAQQSNVGNVSGVVRDSSGAVMPEAEVVAINQTTGLKQPTVTTTDGLYNVNLLPVGVYTVTATKTGFQQSQRAEVPVIAGQTFTVNFVLQIGSVTQTVTVTGA